MTARFEQLSARDCPRRSGFRGTKQNLADWTRATRSDIASLSSSIVYQSMRWYSTVAFSVSGIVDCGGGLKHVGILSVIINDDIVTSNDNVVRSNE